MNAIAVQMLHGGGGGVAFSGVNQRLGENMECLVQVVEGEPRTENPKESEPEKEEDQEEERPKAGKHIYDHAV